MSGPLPCHRPLLDWEARVNARWIIADLEREAGECTRVVLSMQPIHAREQALQRRDSCRRLIDGYQRFIEGSSGA